MKKYLSFAAIFLVIVLAAAVILPTHFFSQFAQAVGGNTPPAYCTQNWQNLPTSSTYQQANWSIDFMYDTMPGSSYNNYTDVNGDGLVDYLFYRIGFSNREACLLLNNGNGWDQTYVCYMKNTNGVYQYYGDCADIP